MQFVAEEFSETGSGVWRFLNPAAYIAELERLAPLLPDGARRFATDSDHYDFYSEKCVKDLKLESVTYFDDGDEVRVELGLRFNDLGRAPELSVVYRDVAEFRIDVAAGQSNRGRRRLGVLMLDEILPCEQGASHELVFRAGSVWVVCADLEAEWTVPSPPSAQTAEAD